LNIFLKTEYHCLRKALIAIRITGYNDTRILEALIQFNRSF